MQVSERGWAWLVSGRRLLVWRYAQAGSEAASRRLALCRELTLPPSDLAHRAELVQVRPTSRRAESAGSANVPRVVTRLPGYGSGNAAD